MGPPTNGLATSAESKGLVKRLLATEPLGAIPRRIVEMPSVRGRLVKMFRIGQPGRLSPRDERSGGGHDPAAAAVVRRFGEGGRVLGLEDLVPTARAIELTAQWARQARIAGRG